MRSNAVKSVMSLLNRNVVGSAPLGSWVVPNHTVAPPICSEPDRSYCRPLTLVVESSTTLAHGPAQPAGGTRVPVKFCALPSAALDWK